MAETFDNPLKNLLLDKMISDGYFKRDDLDKSTIQTISDLKDSEEEDLYDDYANYDDDDEAEDSNNDGNDYSDYDDMEDDDGMRDSSNIARRLWST